MIRDTVESRFETRLNACETLMHGELVCWYLMYLKTPSRSPISYWLSIPGISPKRPNKTLAY